MIYYWVILGLIVLLDFGYLLGYNFIGMGNKGMDKGEIEGNIVVVGVLRKDGSYKLSRI